MATEKIPRGLPLLAAGLAGAILAGCATAPDSEPTRLLGHVARDVLILPLNVTAVMPSELEALSPEVWKQLEVYLRAHASGLKTVAPSDARQIWLRGVRQARTHETDPRAVFDAAARSLVAELRQYAEFDTVVLPALHLRKARVFGTTAFWDGVERVLEVEAGRGEAPAASLHVVVMDAEGRKLHEAFGGLELLVRARVGDPGGLTGRQNLDFATRTDLFANEEHVREGIAKALGPLLPPPEPHPL